MQGCREVGELCACWHLSYVLKCNLILHLSMHALLAKRLITTDSVKCGVGPQGAGTSQIAFP